MSDNAPARAARAEHPNRWRWVRDTGVVLVVAAVSAGSGILGARVGADATLRSTTSQLAESRAQVARDKRAAVYATYLHAANGYALATASLIDGVLKIPDRDPHIDVTKEPFKSFFPARDRYQSAINDLYVYGSDPAWQAHTRVADTLPESIGPPQPFGDPLHIGPIDWTTYEAAYHGFQKVFCQEVPALPRRGC